MSVIYDKNVKSTADSNWGKSQVKAKGLQILLYEEVIPNNESVKSSVCSNSKYNVNVNNLIHEIKNLL